MHLNYGLMKNIENILDGLNNECRYTQHIGKIKRNTVDYQKAKTSIIRYVMRGNEYQLLRKIIQEKTVGRKRI